MAIRLIDEIEPKGWKRWLKLTLAACLTLLLALAVAVTTSSHFGRICTTLVVDRNGTVRIGGIFSLQNKQTRRSVLLTASRLNGAKFNIVVFQGASLSNLVEGLESTKTPCEIYLHPVGSKHLP